MHDTWAARDLPVLDATIALLEQSFMVTVTDIAARCELAPTVVAASLEALDPVYVDFRKTTTGGDPRYWYVFKVTPEARRAVGQWPTAEALASRLAEELAAEASHELDAERQGLLVYAARLVGDTLRDATVRAAGRVLAPAFGGVPVPELGAPVPEPDPEPEADYPSLVELPELPELLRSRNPAARTTPQPASDEPNESTAVPPAVPAAESAAPGEPEAVQLAVPEAAADPVSLPDQDEGEESDDPAAADPAVPEVADLGPLPDHDEPGAVRLAVPEAEELEPLPEPDVPDAAATEPSAISPPPDPDDVTAH